MKISVIGTGAVGRRLAAALERAGHEVLLGTRDPAQTLARTEASATGAPPLGAWHEDYPSIPLVPLSEAATHAAVIVNATQGAASLAALEAASPREGQTIMDVSNPLDPSTGFPPSLSICNTDSLAEQLQRRFPAAKVVKTLNTVNNMLMVDPARLPESHTMFVAGDHTDAKALVTGLLHQLGWPAEDILDLGGLESARGMEMYLPLWLRLLGALGHADFNIKIVRKD
ncbi:NADPH-dependent F420 reductase [Arthrobacter crystallopoietes]|uniref:NADPH-dependent F420 reductase n=1 Tax=Crystallibacter crystallopoietes TaxID=37928 RepID=UPI001ABE6D25|nr:NAD(P)-binding domain-containing protein [Arthrobacter crystallopoietes]QTG81155.1 NAD(P)-binding domain-containing protein [Arthrobacter crystallopoietes]